MPGLYALGLPVLRRRKSTFIHGIEDDAREVVEHLSRYLAANRPASTLPPGATWNFQNGLALFPPDLEIWKLLAPAVHVMPAVVDRQRKGPEPVERP